MSDKKVPFHELLKQVQERIDEGRKHLAEEATAEQEQIDELNDNFAPKPSPWGDRPTNKSIRDAASRGARPVSAPTSTVSKIGNFLKTAGKTVGKVGVGGVITAAQEILRSDPAGESKKDMARLRGQNIAQRWADKNQGYRPANSSEGGREARANPTKVADEKPTPKVPAPSGKAASTSAPAKLATNPASKTSDVVKTVKTKGGEYNVYKKDSEKAQSFRDAYNKATGNFEWEGRKYAKPETKSSSEPAKPAVNTARAADSSEGGREARSTPAPATKPENRPEPPKPNAGSIENQMAKEKERETEVKVKAAQDRAVDLSTKPNAPEPAPEVEKSFRPSREEIRKQAAEKAKNNKLTAEENTKMTNKLIEAVLKLQEIKHSNIFEAAKKLDPVGKEDADIDNDGDSDKSDKYLKNRRKAIAKAMKEQNEISEVTLDEGTKISSMKGTKKIGSYKSENGDKFDLHKADRDGEEVHYLVHRDSGAIHHGFVGATKDVKRFIKDYGFDQLPRPVKEETIDEANSPEEARAKFNKYNDKELDMMIKRNKGKAEKGDSHKMKRFGQARDAAYGIMYKANAKNMKEEIEVEFSDAEIAHLEAVFGEEAPAPVKRGRGRPRKDAAPIAGEESPLARVAAQVRTARAHFVDGKEVHTVRHPETGKSYNIATHHVRKFNQEYATAEKAADKDKVEKAFIAKHMS